MVSNMCPHACNHEEDFEKPCVRCSKPYVLMVKNNVSSCMLIDTCPHACNNEEEFSKPCVRWSKPCLLMIVNNVSSCSKPCGYMHQNMWRKGCGQTMCGTLSIHMLKPHGSSLQVKIMCPHTFSPHVDLHMVVEPCVLMLSRGLLMVANRRFVHMFFANFVKEYFYPEGGGLKLCVSKHVDNHVSLCFITMCPQAFALLVIYAN